LALNVYVHATAESVAVNVAPAMVAVNVCCAAVVFGDAVTVTLPFPDPDAGATDSAALAVEVDHADGAHPDGEADMFTTCAPPPIAKFADDGEIANVHGLFVAVGWVVEGVFVGDEPLQAAIARRVNETASAMIRFIRRDYSGVRRSRFRRARPTYLIRSTADSAVTRLRSRNTSKDIDEPIRHTKFICKSELRG
jgi:hypothetical protein